MTEKKPDPDTESETTTHVWAKVGLRVERAAIPTVGELEGVKVVVETTSGGRLVRIAILVALALALTYVESVPTPW